jgi:hypothetical protein
MMPPAAPDHASTTRRLHAVCCAVVGALRRIEPRVGMVHESHGRSRHDPQAATIYLKTQWATSDSRLQ